MQRADNEPTRSLVESPRVKTGSKPYTSGMVQSWNKFCFTGGVLEMSIQLPGHADSGGKRL